MKDFGSGCFVHTCKITRRSTGGTFVQEISDTDFDANVDFVIDQIGGFEPFVNPSGGTSVPQGNMHLYELGAYRIALTETQVREISNDMISKHGIL